MSVIKFRIRDETVRRHLLGDVATGGPSSKMPSVPSTWSARNYPFVHFGVLDAFIRFGDFLQETASFDITTISLLPVRPTRLGRSWTTCGRSCGLLHCRPPRKIPMTASSGQSNSERSSGALAHSLVTLGGSRKPARAYATARWGGVWNIYVPP